MEFKMDAIIDTSFRMKVSSFLKAQKKANEVKKGDSDYHSALAKAVSTRNNLFQFMSYHFKGYHARQIMYRYHRTDPYITLRVSRKFKVEDGFFKIFSPTLDKYICSDSFEIGRNYANR